MNQHETNPTADLWAATGPASSSHMPTAALPTTGFGEQPVVPGGAMMANGARRSRQTIIGMGLVGGLALIAGLIAVSISSGETASADQPAAPVTNPVADAGDAPPDPEVAPAADPSPDPAAGSPAIEEPAAEEPVAEPAPVDEPEVEEPAPAEPEPAEPEPEPEGPAVPEPGTPCALALSEGYPFAVLDAIESPLHAIVPVVNCVDGPVWMEFWGEDGMTLANESTVLLTGETFDLEVSIDEEAWDGEMAVGVMASDCCHRTVLLTHVGPLPDFTIDLQVIEIPDLKPVFEF